MYVEIAGFAFVTKQKMKINDEIMLWWICFHQKKNMNTTSFNQVNMIWEKKPNSKEKDNYKMWHLEIVRARVVRTYAQDLEQREKRCGDVWAINSHILFVEV